MNRYAGALALEPEELQLLQQCLDRLLSERRIDRGSDTAENYARALIAAYTQGVRDPDKLIAFASR